jgi:hypothetical protein
LIFFFSFFQKRIFNLSCFIPISLYPLKEASMKKLLSHKTQLLIVTLIFSTFVSCARRHSDQAVGTSPEASTASQLAGGALDLTSAPVTDVVPSLSFSYTIYDYSEETKQFTTSEVLHNNFYFYTTGFRRGSSTEAFPSSVLKVFADQGIKQADISKEGYVIEVSDGKKFSKGCYVFAVDSRRNLLLLSQKEFDLSKIEFGTAGNLCLNDDSRFESVDNKSLQLGPLDLRFDIRDNFFLFLAKKGFSPDIRVLFAEDSSITTDSETDSGLGLWNPFKKKSKPKVSAKATPPSRQAQPPAAKYPPKQAYSPVALAALQARQQNPSAIVRVADSHAETKGRFPDATKVKELGSGSYGKVFKICEKLKECFAVKIPKVQTDAALAAGDVENALHRTIYAKVDQVSGGHGKDYIIPPLDRTDLRRGEVAMPVAETVPEAISSGKLSFEQFVLQSNEAVRFLKEAGFQHNDVKPDNFLFHDGRVKLTDFGSTKERGHVYTDDAGASPYYLDPGPNGINSPLRDDYALGKSAEDFYTRFQGKTDWASCMTPACLVAKKQIDPHEASRIDANGALAVLRGEVRLRQTNVAPPLSAAHNRLPAGNPISRPPAPQVFYYVDYFYAFDNYGNWFKREADGRFYHYQNPYPYHQYQYNPYRQ